MNRDDVAGLAAPGGHARSERLDGLLESLSHVAESGMRLGEVTDSFRHDTGSNMESKFTVAKRRATTDFETVFMKPAPLTVSGTLFRKHV